MKVLSQGGWFESESRVAEARVRLVCFPYAGGGSGVFRDWQALLAPAVEVWAVQLPGRESRLFEEPYVAVDAAVEAVVAALADCTDRPLALFGHCMGAMLAFETARALERRAPGMVRHLFVAASRSADLPVNEADGNAYRLPDAEMLAYLGDVDGCAQEVRQNAELMSLLLPMLRADLRMVGTYAYVPGAPLRCGISAFYGRDDDVPAALVAAWGGQTRGSFALHEMPGGHFFIQTHCAEVARAIRADLCLD